MNCSKCGSVLPEDADIRFCPECGSPLAPQMQIPQANAGGGAPQQAGTARGYGGNPSGGFAPRAPGYEPPDPPVQGNAGIYGGTPSVGGYDPGRSGYAPPGAGFPSNAGGSDDKVSPGGSGEYGPQAGASAGKGSGGGNKMFLAIVIPLIAVILAALTIIFIFVIYPEIAGDPEETATEPAAASQETESDTEAAEAATASQAPSETAQDTAAETESVTAASPVSASGYHTGHYVNSTESRVHIRNTTSKSGKHLDYVQPEEYIDVFEVLDLGASTDATVRWWGKVTKGGKTGWVSLYYLTCVDLMGTPLNADQIDQLWQALQGYWNTLDKKRYSSFSTDNGSLCFVYSPWSGSAVISARADAEGMGDLNGLIRLYLHEDAADASGAANAELYLDLSEMKNGRIAWSFGAGWEDGYFAGTDRSKAKPKS